MKRPECVEEYLGEEPSYLAQGLEAWDKACDEQAEHGIKALEGFERYELFNAGVWMVMHELRKICSVTKHTIKEINGKPANFPELRPILGFYNPLHSHYEYNKTESERKTNEYQSKFLHPLFERLMHDGSEDDLVRAGESILAGNYCDGCLKILSQESRILLPLELRSWDFRLHRRIYTLEESNALRLALSKRLELNNFYQSNEFRPFRFNNRVNWPKEILDKLSDLESAQSSTYENWQNAFRLAV